MEKKNIGSMKNFSFFKKLKKTKKNSPINFFDSCFFNYYICNYKKKFINQPFDNIFINSYNIPSPEDILIDELKKPIITQNKYPLITSKKDVSKIVKQNSKLNRNIESMLIALKKNKNCIRFFKLNFFDDNQIRIILSLATTAHYEKGDIIYRANTKATKFFMILKGKVSIKTLNPEMIKYKKLINSYKFEEIYNDILIEQKVDNYLNYEDNISELHFINKEKKSNENKEIILSEENENNENNKTKKKNDKKSSDIILEKYRYKLVNSLNKASNDHALSITHAQNKPRKTIINSLRPKNYENYIEKEKQIKKNLQILQNKLGQILDIFDPGAFMGEKELILEKPYNEYAFAEEETDLFIIDKVNFDKYISKQITLAEINKRNFLMKYVPFLQSDEIFNISPHFYDKDNIIYTQFDNAEDFFLIYQGYGELRKVKDKDICKKKGDLIYNINNLETICIIDKGCLVGLESYKKGKYENNFIIMEDNTILFRFNFINYKNNQIIKTKYNLSKELQRLYIKHKIFCIRNKQNKEESKKINEKINCLEYDRGIKEEKCNELFKIASQYHYNCKKNKKNKINKSFSLNKIRIFNFISNFKKDLNFPISQKKFLKKNSLDNTNYIYRNDNLFMTSTLNKPSIKINKLSSTMYNPNNIPKNYHSFYSSSFDSNISFPEEKKFKIRNLKNDIIRNNIKNEKIKECFRITEIKRKNKRIRNEIFSFDKYLNNMVKLSKISQLKSIGYNSGNFKVPLLINVTKNKICNRENNNLSDKVI